MEGGGIMENGAKLEELLQLLDLEQIEENIFRATSCRQARPALWWQIMSQALMAVV